MARSKPKTTIIADPKQAEAAMQELAHLGRRIQAVEIEAQEKIDQAKADAAAEIGPHAARRKELEKALATYATLNKDELFDKRRSRSTPFGVYGWRKSTELKTITGMKLADVLERLHELKFKKAISVKESVDKTAMQKWPDSRLRTVGMRRVTKDVFYIEVTEDNLEADE
jgi:phage host-nuclease inhibitor protein Gam